MKHAIRALLGLLVLGAMLFGTAGRGRWLLFAVVLYLVFILISVFSPRIRVHWLTFELQGVMAFASLISVLILLAGVFLLVRIRVTANTSIGIESNFLFIETIDPLRSARFGLAASPPAIFEVRTDRQANPLMFPPLGWTRSVAPSFFPATLIAIPSGLAWLIRMKPVRPGRCAKCEYDLTGNTSGVCPECGQQIRSDTNIV